MMQRVVCVHSTIAANQIIFIDTTQRPSHILSVCCRTERHDTRSEQVSTCSMLVSILVSMANMLQKKELVVSLVIIQLGFVLK